MGVVTTKPACLPLDVGRIRHDFPILSAQVHGHPLVYLDNAATSQKPSVVLDALHAYYTQSNSNINRGVHALGERATEAYAKARDVVQLFLNAQSVGEIVFTRGTTEAINLVAQAYGASHLKVGDRVLISQMEHHSNIVPWQMICQQTGAGLDVIPVSDDGELMMSRFESQLTDRTKIVAIAHISNAIGTVNPVLKIIQAAHANGAVVLLDAAQSIPHMAIDVQSLDCDFLAFSGHKTYGPTGIGVLYGKAALLADMTPYQGGGAMIRSVGFDQTTYRDPPDRFEAGTPNIAGAIGLAAAIGYMNQVGLPRISAYEADLLDYALQGLESVGKLRLIGRASNRAASVSFVIDGIHPHDIGTILDDEGVAIRAGHHCAQPLMSRFGIPATARASIAMYNTKHEVDALVRAIQRAIEVFGV